MTHLQWGNSACADLSYGNRVLESMTLPVGGMTALTHTCLDVCEAPSPSACSNTTSWSVVDTVFECPNNESGVSCPIGSPQGDFLTTQYEYGTIEDNRNYTGYPRYSLFMPSVASADALMSAPDAGSFTYTTVVTKRRATTETIHQVQTDYNFLHLQQEQRIFVSDGSSPNLMLSKQTSHCYPISDTAPTDDCPLTTANYQNLPSNYQSPIFIGSCQYNVGENATAGLARRSVVTMDYDGFGNVIRKRTYHASGSKGIVSDCDRATRLSTDGIRLVTEDHMQQDTPTTVTEGGYVELGAGSGHFGLLVSHQSFVYLDEDDSGVGAHEALAGTDGPIMVKLLCNELTADSDAETSGTAIKTSTWGLMSTSAAAPEILGIISACDSANWDPSVAPPKMTTYTYDEQGRSLVQTTAWADGYTAPGGVSATTQHLEYTTTGSQGGEEDCDEVLQITSTDDPQNPKTKTVNRVCTLNGFHLSATDGDGNTTLMEHSANGLTTKITHADGTYVTVAHYYACPLGQDGRTQTCPATATALQDCPYDSQEQKRNCVVKTMHSASPGESFLDGVMSVTIKDGLGRLVETLDNLGGGAGAGYTATQTRTTMTYDDRGMLKSRSQHSGVTDPIVYTTTNTLDEKLRPSLVCGPRGQAHQFIHDDVNQKTMTIFNGSDREGYVMNDSQKQTTIANCDLVAGETTSGSGDCPTVANDLSSAECQGDAYFTYTLHDGTGQEHSVAAMAGAGVDTGASVTSINGVTTYSTDMLKYGYSVTSANEQDLEVSASSSFTRDLQGHVREHILSVDVTRQADGEPVTTSSTFASDQFTFDNVDQKVAERNKLSDVSGAPTLEETYTYTLSGQLESMTTYEGVTFQNYYDSRNRLVRHCFPTDTGAEGEKMDLDPISGAIMRVTRFTNDSACSQGDSADGDVVSETYTYTRFGAIESTTYSDGTRLEWAYDPYQRMTCFADALATSNGGSCPDSPTAVDFSPDASDLLVSYRYWEDGDPYRRGLLKSTCRGVSDGSGGLVTKCMDTDYYTPADTGGSCPAALSGIVGAYAGLVKTETYCTGGSCLDGDGTLVYQTTRAYDEYRRPCRVESVNGDGDVILSSAYGYGQFENVVHEENFSDLDASTDSNYQLDNVYDGLLRLVQQTRRDLAGNLIEDTTYKYDAASNLVQRIQELPDVAGPPPPPGPVDTPKPTVTSAPVPMATSTSGPTVAPSPTAGG